MEPQLTPNQLYYQRNKQKYKDYYLENKERFQEYYRVNKIKINACNRKYWKFYYTPKKRIPLYKPCDIVGVQIKRNVTVTF